MHPPFSPYPLGVFTCFDILFSTPAPELVANGVHHFLYSAAIPLVGAAAESTWSWLHASTLIGSNLQDGQSGVFVNGTRITATPASGANVVLLAEIA